MTRPIIRIATGIALAIVAQPIGASPAVTPPWPAAPAVHPFAAHIAEAARRFGIPEGWIWAVIRVESRGNPRAMSPAGAMGLMQLMPATWATLRARYGLGADPFDPRDNIMAGGAYLRAMHDRYGDPTAMLAAYNAGPGRYDDYLSRGRPLPAETIAYVAQLSGLVGGSTDTQLVAAPPSDPLAWRRAGLFINVASNAVPVASTTDVQAGARSSDGDAIAGNVSRDTLPDRRPNDRAVDEPRAVEMQPDSLFVRRAGTVRPQ